VFVVDTTGGREALVLTDELRRAGRSADRAYDARSMKAQMRAADRSGAALAIIVGPGERDAGTAVLRPLRGDGEQAVVARAEVVSSLAAHLEASTP
jgi:histidyl-tRNA synthetase